ncbi:hypothetical protein GQ457_10G002520 [Hibiscus cannabinus]
MCYFKMHVGLEPNSTLKIAEQELEDFLKQSGHLPQVLSKQTPFIIHVHNTSTLTLKDEIFSVLSRYCFDIKNIRGQGYDNASNMREKWNGLQALVRNGCHFAYYVHCFAHHLQLALVAAAKEVIPIYQFFSKLSFIINVVLASFKDSDKFFKVEDICNLVNKFYPEDFTKFEKDDLRTELCHYKVELSWNSGLEKLSSISGLSQWLVDTRKMNIYAYIFRVVKLLLTLPVSTASAERAFSTMNVVKTTIRNKMDDGFFRVACLSTSKEILQRA